jgi:hypothetical protein
MRPHDPRRWERSRHLLTDCSAAVDASQWQRTPAVVRRRLGRFDDRRFCQRHELQRSGEQIDPSPHLGSYGSLCQVWTSHQPLS